MSIAFPLDNAIEAMRYVKPTFFSFQLDIPAEEAETIEGPFPYFKSEPAVQVTFTATWNWSIMLGSFNWGDTSRPGKVYYEIHIFGDPYDELDLPVPVAPVFREGFFNNAFVLRSNIENPAPHIFVDDRIEFKIWNATGSDPEDVYVECTFWYFAIRNEYLEKVYEPYVRDTKLLSDQVKLTKAHLGLAAGLLGPSDIVDLLKKTGLEEEI